MAERLVIGGASGFWGEAGHATAQLLAHPGLDVLVFDYLAEVTMSIMARARLKDPAKGYATDFVTDAMAPNLRAIADKGVTVISNAGGMNPDACAEALRAEIAKQGLSLKVGVVKGDDLIARAAEFEGAEGLDGAVWPGAGKMTSINAYLGAQPLVAALAAGADIVVTGRVVDSAVTLAVCIHRFGWTDPDLLAAGSLAGHLLECGPQATGGNFTDWREAGDIAAIGYPVAGIAADGAVTMTKPKGTTGAVTPLSVGEQMLYEIGDPCAYALPDVICDFTGVTLTVDGPDRVSVAGAKGRPPTGRLKVCATWADGYRAGQVLFFAGRDAGAKGRAFADAALARARAKLRALNAPDYDDVSIEPFGGRAASGVEEVALTAAVRHRDPRAVGLFLKELIGAALATPPGLHFFTGGGRPKPSPVLRLFSFLIDAGKARPDITVEGEPVAAPPPPPLREDLPPPPQAPAAPVGALMRDVPLEALAVARSGDKGDTANIGVLPRHRDLAPFIWAALHEDAVRAALPHASGAIRRWHLPGTGAINILCEKALGGGGVASILNDPQGKAYAQRLLALKVSAPAALIDAHGKELS